MKSVDVIIPVYNPDKRLYSLLKRLLKQTVVPSNIRIILTITEKFGGLDLIHGLAEKGIRDERIKVITIEKAAFNHGGTRQMAAEESDSDFCLFMTQDAVPADRFLVENMLKEAEKTYIGVCYARQLPLKNATVREKFARSFNYPDKSMIKDKRMLDAGNIKAIFCSDVCAMYDMELFRSLGGFERNVDFNEDMLYAHKVLKNGYKISYCADAKVFHSHNLSFSDQFKRNRDIAVSQKEHPEVFSALSSENEGLRYLRKGLKYTLSNGNIFEAAGFICDCGFRFLGFRVGKMHKVQGK